jgi:hypothetical protein
MSLPINIIREGDKHFPGFNIPSEGFVRIDDNFLERGYKDNNGFTYVSDIEELKKNEVITNMTCLGYQKSGILCQEDKKEDGASIIHLFSAKTLDSVHRNKMMYIVGKLKIIGEEGKSLYGLNQDRSFYLTGPDETLLRSSSIEDITESLNSLHYIQLQGIYNTMELGKSVKDTRNITTHLVSHLMQKDSYMLGSILNESILYIVHCKRQTRPLVREGAPYQKTQWSDIIKIWS